MCRTPKVGRSFVTYMYKVDLHVHVHCWYALANTCTLSGKDIVRLEKVILWLKFFVLGNILHYNPLVNTVLIMFFAFSQLGDIFNSSSPAHICVRYQLFFTLPVLQACAVVEATLSHSRETLTSEKRNQKALKKSFDEVSGVWGGMGESLRGVWVR